MPQTSPPSTLLRERKPKRAAGWVVVLLFLTGCCGGCRSLPCRKESDETISLTRQLSLRGKDAQQKGRWDQAETFFAQAVAASPKDERARCGYAESLWRRGAQDQAVTHMVEAVKLSGDDPERLVQLGQMYLAQNNLPAAGRQADKAIAANKHLPNAWALRGNVYRATGQRDEALAAYHRALSYTPHFPEVQVALAEIYSQSHKPQRALATLQSLADQFPPGNVPADVLFRQGIVLRQLNRNQDAAECIAAAVNQGQPTAEMLFELAQTRMLAGDPTAANLALNGALQIDPRHAPSLQMQRELASQPKQLTASLGPGTIDR
ncbi:tetratricopeptide repeat protein [Anatilimnocola sp. NA78]|uniref:tetratricopeptide repeat protein n=1 Tax=Anatilimnocola sp. NA78 TaxID=3415683 RepID=UPI003CE58E3C